MEISLNNRTIVVTGGAKRLGRAIALECARSGADVAITYRESEADAHDCLAELAEVRAGGRYAAYRVEISRAEEVENLLNTVKANFGQIFGLVNSAGVFQRTPFHSMTEADFDLHIGTNLKGPYLTCKFFGDHFLENGAGAIVNFSDIYGIRPLANYIPYCLSKAGVVMLTESLAKALAPTVRVNCICPGTILKPSEVQGEGDEEAELVKRIPMGRLGTAEEIAQTVVFLLGGPNFITGAVLPVDGAQILR